MGMNRYRARSAIGEARYAEMNDFERGRLDFIPVTVMTSILISNQIRKKLKFGWRDYIFLASMI